jgi:acetyl-CoA synthetase
MTVPGAVCARLKRAATTPQEETVMPDYFEAVKNFSAADLERRVLAGSLNDGVNACVECCDRWAKDGAIALEWYGANGERGTLTFAEMRDSAAKFANYLKSHGIGRGDVVAGLLPRVPDLFTVILGAWRVGAMYQPLFTAFGPAAIESRVTAARGSKAKLVVTDVANRPKLKDVPDCPDILTVGDGFAEAIASQSTDFAPVMLKGSEPFVVLFTSGTTGKPKGVRYPLALLLPVASYMLDAIELRPDDNYWNVADPGWAYGMLYAVVGPLMLGHTTTFNEGAFTVESTLRTIADRKITNLAAAPTAYRLLMAAGDEAMAPIAHLLRVASSAGEPLNPEVIRWAERVLHCPLADHYGQTEVAMMINNHHALKHPVKPGAAGLPLPGLEMAILDDDLNVQPANTPGVLAVNIPRSPMYTFTGYWKAESPSIRGDWYITGDTMMRDEDGHFFFVGRNDDIITSAGYRIGPFDVESVVMEHPAVAEVAVIGKPDPQRTEIVKAVIVLKSGVEGTENLKSEIQQLVRQRLSTHAYPREIDFIAALPKTPSGKIQRFILRGGT